MKPVLRIIILLNIILILTACKAEDISPLLYKDNSSGISNSYDKRSSDNDTIKLNYTIDKITLSKNYQSINPSVEIIKDGLDSNLLLSLGIVESSGIEIEKIEKDDKDISIYVQNENKDSEGKIVVPQALLHLEDFSLKDMESLNFKIINQNYNPVKANIDVGEAISKIESSLKVSTSTFPDVDIDKKDDKLFLNLDFKNAVDLEEKENPIINLNVLIDIVDSKIISSTKEPVSSLIDEGTILDYVANKYILYTKEETIKEDINTSLWIYNIEKDTKEKIYTTKNKITNLSFNKKGDKVFLIESFLEYKELYILEIEDLKVYKANIDKAINPCIGTWKDDKNIVLVDKNDKYSKVFNLNILSNNLDFIASIEDDISDIQYLKDNFIFTIEDDKSKEIYITKDFKDNLLVDKGNEPLFIDKETIGYLKENNSKDKTILCFYNIKDRSISSYSNLDIKNFFIWKNNLGIIEKNHIGSDNPLYIYDFKKEKIKFVTSVKNDRVFLNSEKNILYINSCINIKKNKTPVISFIDLEQ